MDKLQVAHRGRFSEITPSLVGALSELTEVRTVDFMELARRARSLPIRARALAQARAFGSDWTRTPAWSRAIELHVKRMAPGPVLFMQTVLACAVDVAHPYVVFTDRTATEGLRSAGAWAAKNTRGWLAIEAHFLSRAQHVFVMGPSSVPHVQEAGVDARRITVTGSGTSSRLPPVRNRQFGKCKNLLFVGKEWERKGGPTLSRAIEQVHAETPYRLTLDVVGCSPSAKPYMRVHGVVPPGSMAGFFDSADAFAMPTSSEAFGVAFAEALQCGLPVLGSTVGNVPWIIEDGGVCPSPDSARAVASALVDLIENYGEYSQHAATLAMRRADTWQWPRIASEIIACLEAC